MASKEQLRKIAIYCDKYNPNREDDLNLSSNVSHEKYESCENCSHFTNEGKCDIDLIDKVLSSLAMELDLKR
jgi:recombinational DNA repair protein RecR